MKVSADVATEFRKRRDSLFVEISRRKDSLMEEVHTFQNYSGVQTVVHLPLKSVAYVAAVIRQRIDAFNHQIRIAITHLHSCKAQALVLIQNFSEINPYGIQLREITARRCETIYLMCISVRVRAQMIWTNIFSNQTIIRLYQQLMDFLKNGTVKTQESAEAIVSRVVDSGGVFLNNIPQEKRQIATGLYVQLCSKVRSSIGDVKADVISNYIFESALAAWLRKAAQSAS